MIGTCVKYFWILLLASVSIKGVATDEDERCLLNNIKVQENFNLDKYLGVWYELKWIPEKWFPPQYNFKDYVIKYEKYNSTTIRGDWAGRESNEKSTCLSGIVNFTLTDTPGKLIYLRDGPNNTILTSDHWIVLTDYDNYALAWGCREQKNGICIKEDGWVWSRETTMKTSHMDLIDAKITEVCLNHTAFFITDQIKECFSNTGGAAKIQISAAVLLPLLSLLLYQD